LSRKRRAQTIPLEIRGRDRGTPLARWRFRGHGPPAPLPSPRPPRVPRPPGAITIPPKSESHSQQGASPIHDHSRLWRDHLYVYPVVSRRSRGMSIGVNLNRDKRCTFACAYCQVDRGGACASGPTDLGRLREELVETLR
jgi:hypothetical protein